MNEAAALLVGDHDFRNLCKMDMAHVSNFRRLAYPLNHLCSLKTESSMKQRCLS